MSILVRKIQTILFLINNIHAELSLDSGCEGDCVKETECLRLGIVGKAKFSCSRDKIVLSFDGYVVKNLQANILCWAAFLSRNEIIQELHKNKVVIDGKFHKLESTPLCPDIHSPMVVSHMEAQRPEENKYLKSIIIKEKLPQSSINKLNKIHTHLHKVFDEDLSEGYNDYSGNFKVNLNFQDDVPPPTQLGCVPNRELLLLHFRRNIPSKG